MIYTRAHGVNGGERIISRVFRALGAVGFLHVFSVSVCECGCESVFGGKISARRGIM